MPKQNQNPDIWAMNEIPHTIVRRMPTGFPELDDIFGSTTFPDGSIEYGLPKGRISYGFGEQGVGKTRLVIAICHRLNALGARILVCQGEVRPEEFRQWLGQDPEHPEIWWVTDRRNPGVLCQLIEQYRPHFVVVDSANMLDEYNRISACKAMFDRFKGVMADTKAHCLMIGQLNKDVTAKGPTDVQHLVDAVLHIKGYEPDPKKGADLVIPGGFFVQMQKNRYGSSGGWVGFQHQPHGVDLHVRPDGIPSCSMYIDTDGGEARLTLAAELKFPPREEKSSGLRQVFSNWLQSG